jgi:hypothetical protein
MPNHLRNPSDSENHATIACARSFWVRLLAASSPIAATTRRPPSLQGPYLGPEATRHRTHQARAAPPPGCRARSSATPKASIAWAQLPRRPTGRCDQRRPRRRGIQFPKTAGLARALAVRIPVRDGATYGIKNAAHPHLLRVLHGRLPSDEKPSPSRGSVVRRAAKKQGPPQCVGPSEVQKI